MIISQFPASGGSGGALPQFTYTGEYTSLSDSGGWKIKFLSSGVLSMLSAANVDIFLVGSGGRGSNYRSTEEYDGHYYYRYGGGGGSGYTLTEKNVRLLAGANYNIQVGELGTDSYIQPQNGEEWNVPAYTAAHGSDGSNSGAHEGGNGGSGGAEPSVYATYSNGSYYTGFKSKSGAKDGGSISGGGGTGQGTTTREFGEPSGELYASGGGSYYSSAVTPAVVPNTGNGGTGGNSGAGASGIVIIRNAR